MKFLRWPSIDYSDSAEFSSSFGFVVLEQVLLVWNDGTHFEQVGWCTYEAPSYDWVVAEGSWKQAEHISTNSMSF